MSSFSAFNLSKEMVNALSKLGYKTASPVQERIIPKALSGASLICQSETGSGKTHSYLVPIIDKLDLNLPKLQSVIICPSRELARQVYDFAREIGRYFHAFKVRLLTSSNEKKDNEEGLSKAPHMVVGTPGRLADILAKEYSLDLHSVKTLVLDEADMLLELGYFEDIDAVYSLFGEKVQTMVFSATLEENLKDKIKPYIGSKFLYEGEKDKSSSNVSHHLVDIKHVNKQEALDSFLKIVNPYLAIVFASKKEEVAKTYGYLKDKGYSVTMFSGDLDVRERRRKIKLIKENRFQIIVASDLLARGIDIEDVTHVISIDLPEDLDYYHHRAGRTARFGKKGDSYVFYDSDSTRLPLILLSQGVPFDFFILKNGELSSDPIGLSSKRKPHIRKDWADEEQRKEIKIAKANSRSKTVKPGYKKKTKQAVEKVKSKYRRIAIKKKVKAQKDEAYRQRAKWSKGE